MIVYFLYESGNQQLQPKMFTQNQ